MSTCDGRTNSIPVRFVCFASMIVAVFVFWTDTVDAGHLSDSEDQARIKNSLPQRKLDRELQDTACSLDHIALLRQRPLSIIDKMDFIPRTNAPHPIVLLTQN